MNAGPKGMIPARALWTGGSFAAFVWRARRPRFVPQGGACREGWTSSVAYATEEGLIRPVVERKECRVDMASTRGIAGKPENRRSSTVRSLDALLLAYIFSQACILTPLNSVRCSVAPWLAKSRREADVDVLKESNGVSRSGL